MILVYTVVHTCSFNGLEHNGIGFINIALKPSNSKEKVSTERKVCQHSETPKSLRFGPQRLNRKPRYHCDSGASSFSCAYPRACMLQIGGY